MFKKILLLTIFITTLVGGGVTAQEGATIGRGSEKEEVTLYFFEDRYCGVCRSQKVFMEEVIDNYPHIVIKTYPITDRKKLNEIGKMYGVEEPEMMAPTTFIGENYFQFMQFTENEAQKLIRAMEGETIDDDCCLLRIPILNIRVDIREWSLPLMTVVLGSLDGFNVCSLGALILILSIVLAFKSRRKIFFYGGLFILVSVTVYGFLVFAWRGLHELFAQYTNILGLVIGIAAIAGGTYFFKEFWRFFRYGPTCKSSENKIAQKATEKLQNAFQNGKKGGLALAGSIVLFAVIITFVELPCSIGFPIIFTGILADAGIPITTSILYILLYLFFYMLIEVIIFIGAVLTREIWMLNSSAVTWITLFASLIMFYLGYYYLFA